MHTKCERRCVACRKNKQQNEMLRIAKRENEFLIDIQHKIGGRGAYICKDAQCLQLTIKKRLRQNRILAQSLFLQITHVPPSRIELESTV